MSKKTERRPSLRLYRVRLMQAAGLAAMAAPLLYGSACTNTVVVQGGEGGDGGSGEGGAGGTTSSSSSTAVSSSSSGVGGAPTTSSSSVGGSTSVSTGVTTGVGGGGPTEQTCFPVTPNGCPSLNEAFSAYGDCTYETFDWIETWVSGPYEEDGFCCYEVVTNGFCGVGRPLMVAERAVTAAVSTGSHAWSQPAAEPGLALCDSKRDRLAASWARDGLFEHASVASFSRFALELLALGAPPELVAGAHRAALDEVEHAKICFAVASRFAGEPVGAGPLEGAADLAVRADLVDLAVATFREGCVGETIAAIVAAEQRDRARDPQVRRALTVIAEDEARHAELAWQTVAWAIDRGGERVRRAMAEELRTAGWHTPDVEDDGGEDLEAFGRLPRRQLDDLVRRAVVDVVLPCARALLGAAAA